MFQKTVVRGRDILLSIAIALSDTKWRNTIETATGVRHFR